MIYEDLAEEFIQLCMKSSYVRITRELSRTTKPDIFILMYLKNHGGRAYPKDLSNDFLVSSARIAVVLNLLEQKGYIQRLNDEHDSRQTVVPLSNAGEELISEKRSEVVQRIAKMLELLGDDDAKEYIRLQKKLSEAISEAF